MGFSLDVGVPVVTVFLQGLLSFFSPCVLPLVPLYLGYLSGGAGEGELYGKKGRLFLNTICFVIGISTAFFTLGLGVSAAGSFLDQNQAMVARIGGILVILFGLYQLGIFGKSRLLGTEHRFWLKLDKLKMSPIVALIFGFTFSFAWTPCVGPALASVLLMAGSAGTKMTGFLLIGVYTLGFVLPFLAVGLFTAKVLGIFKKYNHVVKYTVKIGGILMIFMGVLMFTGNMNAVTGYLSGAAGTPAQTAGKEASKEENTAKEEDAEDTEHESSPSEEKQDLHPAPDFVLADQYGNKHSLADYKGKTIFLNFWATWCGPCRNEMPEIQKIYEETQQEEDSDLVVLGIAAPGFGQEKSQEEVEAFLEENGYTYPVLMDTTGEVFMEYGISAYPTTFMVDRDGNLFGYIQGQLNEAMMRSIIRQTMEGKRE